MQKIGNQNKHSTMLFFVTHIFGVYIPFQRELLLRRVHCCPELTSLALKTSEVSSEQLNVRVLKVVHSLLGWYMRRTNALLERRF